MMTIDEIRSFMIQWNNKFPIDFWWREKHKVAFLSPKHRECSFIAQLMEYEESKMYNESIDVLQDKKDPYIPNIHEWLKSNDSEEIEEDDIERFRAEAAKLAELEER